jgi:hypothetical protein
LSLAEVIPPRGEIAGKNENNAEIGFSRHRSFPLWFL